MSWLADPWGEGSWRWWDGGQWTGRTAPADPGAAALVPVKTLSGATLELQVAGGWNRTELTLVRGADVVGRYGSRGINAAHNPFEAHAAEGSWLMAPQSYDEWSIAVASLPSGQQIASFGPSVRGEGALAFADGRRFAWRSHRPEGGPGGGALGGLLKSAGDFLSAGLHDRWEIVRDDGRLVLSGGYGAVRGLPGTDQVHDMVLTLDPTADQQAELPVLTLFAGYMLYRLQFQRRQVRRSRDVVFG